MTLSSKFLISRTAAILALLPMGFSYNANAGFLDSIYDVQNTISSIGRTADTIRGSKQAVSNLGEEVGFNNQATQDLQNAQGKIAAGSVLYGKLKNTSLYSQANKSSNPVAMLLQDDTIIYMGAEQNGFYQVQSDKGEGWVSKLLVDTQ